jgi:hypothetical protein
MTWAETLEKKREKKERRWAIRKQKGSTEAASDGGMEEESSAW